MDRYQAVPVLEAVTLVRAVTVPQRQRLATETHVQVSTRARARPAWHDSSCWRTCCLRLLVGSVQLAFDVAEKRGAERAVVLCTTACHASGFPHKVGRRDCSLACLLTQYVGGQPAFTCSTHAMCVLRQAVRERLGKLLMCKDRTLVRCSPSSAKHGRRSKSAALAACPKKPRASARCDTGRGRRGC